MNPEYIMKRPEQQDDNPASGCHYYPHKKARRFRLMHRGLTTSIQWLGETTTSVADSMLERVFTTCGPGAGPEDDFEEDDDNNTIQVNWQSMSHEEEASSKSSKSSSSSSSPTEQPQESTAAKDMPLPTRSSPPKLTLSVRPTKKVPTKSSQEQTTTTTTSAFSAFILPANEVLPSAPPQQERPMLKQVSSPHKKEKSPFSSSSMMFVSTPNNKKTVGPSTTTTTTVAVSPDKIAYGGFLAPNPKDTPTKNRRGRNPFHATTTTPTMLYSSPAAAASAAKVYRPFAMRSPTTPHLVGEQANHTMSSQSMTLGGNTPWKRFHC